MALSRWLTLWVVVLFTSLLAACGGGTDDAEALSEEAQATRLPPRLWQPPANATPRTGNYVYLQSQPGDYIGGGESHLYTQADAVLGLQVTGTLVQWQVRGDQSWSGHFQAPTGATRLKAGYYGNLQRYPFHDPAVGGLDWSGEGRGCNSLTGWVVIDKVRYRQDRLIELQMRFEQHCEGGTPALNGKLVWAEGDTTAPAGPVNPPPATLWQPAAGSTPESGNYVYLESDEGDYVGQGQRYLHTHADASLNVAANGGLLSVGVVGDQRWDGHFQAMNTLTALQPGYYPQLLRYPFHNPTRGGLDWSGEGRGCNTLTGWFAIDSLTLREGRITAIELRFEQHCEGMAAALRGKLRWRESDVTAPAGPVVPPPADLWQPAPDSVPATGNMVYLESEPGDYIGLGQTWLYTPETAQLEVQAFAGLMQISVSGNAFWSGQFQAMQSLAQLQPGYYGSLQRYPFHNPLRGGLSWSGDGRGCNTLSGWFVVDSVSYDAQGLAAIDLRFEQHCEGGAPALRGQVRWQR